MGQRILFVDDEKSILKALERLFFDSDYEIFSAESGEEGLKMLEEYPIDLVVSDMRMPGMDGYQFLKKVKALYPNTTRLILSGYADEKRIINSLIDGSSNIYLLKPWNSEELTRKIAQVFEIRQIFANPALLNIVNSMDNLSFITSIYNSVSRLIDQEASIGEITKVIETDAAVTAAILRIINSACYNIKTGSVAQAINFLGLPVVKSILLTCSLSKAVRINIPPFNNALVASHGVTTNSFMLQIYTQLLRKPVPDNIATAGLLHNIGLLLGLHYFPNDYSQLTRAFIQCPDSKISQLEKESIGISHEELGGYLLNWWSIPYPMVECALFHHDPMHSAIMNKEAVAVVHAASHYAWTNLAPQLAKHLNTGIFSLLGIAQADCERMLQVER